MTNSFFQVRPLYVPTATIKYYMYCHVPNIIIVMTPQLLLLLSIDIKRPHRVTVIFRWSDLINYNYINKNMWHTI